MTDDEPTDDTPRTYTNGDHQGPYRGLDPMQVELLRRLDRLDRVERDVDRIDRVVVAQTASRRFWGWTAGISVPVLLGAAFTLMFRSADAVATSSERVGRTEARIEGQAELIKLLQQEIVELRRRAGLDGHPNSIDLVPPDKYSSADQGGSSPHLPKLHRLHPRCGKIWHSGPLLQMSPQTSGWWMSSISLAKSIDSIDSSSLTGEFWEEPDGEAQPATAIEMTRMILSIPET